jgi:hypothetical protein
MNDEGRKKLKIDKWGIPRHPHGGAMGVENNILVQCNNSLAIQMRILFH